jgi:hypothetical protein
MRKLLSAAACAVALLRTPAFAQETPPAPPDAPPSEGQAPGQTQAPAKGEGEPAPELPRNVISTAPTNLLIGVYSVEYERVLNKSLAVFVSPSYLSSTSTSRVSGGEVATATTGYRGNLGLRLYTDGKAPSGFFLAAQISYENSDGRSVFTQTGGGSTPSGTVKNLVYGGSAIIGFDILLANRVQLSIGFVATLRSHRSIISSVAGEVISDESTSGFEPAGRAHVGFAF